MGQMLQVTRRTFGKKWLYYIFQKVPNDVSIPQLDQERIQKLSRELQRKEEWLQEERAEREKLEAELGGENDSNRVICTLKTLNWARQCCRHVCLAVTRCG